MTFPAEIRLLHPDAAVPKRATAGSAGYDLVPLLYKPYRLPGGGQILLSTGISISLRDPGIAMMILPRSGLGHKHGIVLGNLVGLIDSDYQGEIKISIWNRSADPYYIEPGEPLAQLVFVPVLHPEWNAVDAFAEITERGESGFGHSYKPAALA